ncbi:hypothetical protein EV122DRAFT_256566 [Schizophyllum commune]
MKQICVNNITAWIEGEDKVLKLYQSEINEEEGTAEAWIASETGKTFSVHWKDALSTFDTVGRVTIDGQSCGGKLHKASFGAERAMRKRGKRESSDIRRPFEFVQLELTDDDRYLGEVHEGLGDIVLDIDETDEVWPALDDQPPIMETPKVHEHDKKGVTQCVGFGPAEPARESGAYYASSVRAIARFTFHYRPLG